MPTFAPPSRRQIRWLLIVFGLCLFCGLAYTARTVQSQSDNPGGTVPPSATPTATNTRRPTRTPRPTRTLRPPTATATTQPVATASATANATVTGQATFTPTPTATPTLGGDPTQPSPTPSPTNTSVGPQTPPTPTATSASASLTVTKQDFLFSDVDQNELVSSGDVLLYQIRIDNRGAGPAQQLRLEDPPDANTELVAGSVRVTRGEVVVGNGAGDQEVVVTLDSLAGHASVTVGYQVTINLTTPAQQVQNQATVRYFNIGRTNDQPIAVVSNDPASDSPGDPTITLLDQPAPALAPQMLLPLVLGP
jgi:uncharacterized repeat protein (TIGR01451 family)